MVVLQASEHGLFLVENDVSAVAFASRVLWFEAMRQLFGGGGAGGEGTVSLCCSHLQRLGFTLSILACSVETCTSALLACFVAFARIAVVRCNPATIFS